MIAEQLADQYSMRDQIVPDGMCTQGLCGLTSMVNAVILINWHYDLKTEEPLKIAKALMQIANEAPVKLDLRVGSLSENEAYATARALPSTDDFHPDLTIKSLFKRKFVSSWFQHERASHLSTEDLK